MKKSRARYAIQIAAAMIALCNSVILLSVFPLLFMDRLAVQDWVSTPATLTFLALDRDYNGDGACRVRLTYRYTSKGREYEARDEGHYGVLNPTAAECEAIHEALAPLLHQPNALTCYVNPDARYQSTVIRDVDWPWMIGWIATILVSLVAALVLAMSGCRGLIKSLVRARQLKTALDTG